MNYNIQMSFKREPKGEKIRWIIEVFGRTLDSAPEFSPSSVTMDCQLAVELPTQTHKQLCLLARCFRVVPVVNYAIFLQKGLFSKSSESLHGGWIHPSVRLHSSLLYLLA